jgi:DNA-directed RNA polymerase specialized sigma24 family protein
MDVDADDPERLLEGWRAGRVQRRDLYRAVREAMHQGARRGIGWVLAADPNEQDIEDVVYDAFLEFEAKDPLEVDSLVGLAKHMARLRGIDRGRAIIRERRNIMSELTDRAYQADLEFAADDVRLAGEREVLSRDASDCLASLPADQLSVVTATIMERMSLSDWALNEGKTHQAASRQRTRALESLKRCVQANVRRRQDGEGGPDE